MYVFFKFRSCDVQALKYKAAGKKLFEIKIWLKFQVGSQNKKKIYNRYAYVDYVRHTRSSWEHL